jgi:hypothetical protein
MAHGRRLIAVVALAALAGAGVAACANILGIDDRSLDPLAGGAEGGSAEASPSCADPCPMAMGLNHPFAMAADETNVYWTEYGDVTDTNGSIKSCPVTGCGAGGPMVYAQLQAAPRGIAVDAQNVYWGTAAGQVGTGAIWSCAIGGCNNQPTKVATADTPFGVAVDLTSVYWVEFYDATVNRAPKAGGPVALLWDGGSGTGGPNGPQELVIDTGFAYLNDQNINVFRVPLTGGNLVQMYTYPETVVGVFGLAVDLKDVYIGGLPGIYEMSKSATSGATTLAPNITDVTDLKTDPAGGTLYWADFGSAGNDGTVGKVPLGGGAPVILHQQLVTPEAVAVNSTYAFWVSSGTLASDGVSVTSNTGTLYRTAK